MLQQAECNSQQEETHSERESENEHENRSWS